MMQAELFEVGPRIPLPKLTRLGKQPTPAPIGSGPEGETCRSCQHKVATGNSDRRVYLKCELMRKCWTHGPGTDIRAGWPACSHWEPKAQEVPSE